jgi:hypothetical protein
MLKQIVGKEVLRYLGADIIRFGKARARVSEGAYFSM